MFFFTMCPRFALHLLALVLVQTSRLLPVQAALKFLDAKLTGPPLPEGPQASRVPLSAESRAILLRVLAGAAPNLAPEIAAEVSRLTSIAQGVAVPGLPAVPAQPLFPQDVEDEANDNFQKVIYLDCMSNILDLAHLCA